MYQNQKMRQKTFSHQILFRVFLIKILLFRFTKYFTGFQNHIKKSFLFVCLGNCHSPQYPHCLVKARADSGIRLQNTVRILPEYSAFVSPLLLLLSSFTYMTTYVCETLHQFFKKFHRFLIHVHASSIHD